jgi:hypothetical protein
MLRNSSASEGFPFARGRPGRWDGRVQQGQIAGDALQFRWRIGAPLAQFSGEGKDGGTNGGVHGGEPEELTEISPVRKGLPPRSADGGAAGRGLREALFSPSAKVSIAPQGKLSLAFGWRLCLVFCMVDAIPVRTLFEVLFCRDPPQIVGMVLAASS